MDSSGADQHKAHVAAIAVAYLGNPSVRIEKTELADVIRQIDNALKGETEPTPAGEMPPELPSSQVIRKSIDADFLVSFIDGKRYKTLRRHLTMHGHTPQSYRERYGLKADYPMVAANYSAQRSELAKKLGLGQMRSRSVELAETQETPPLGSSAPDTVPAHVETAPAGQQKRRVAGKRSTATAADQSESVVTVAEASPASGLPRRSAGKARAAGKGEASQTAASAAKPPVKRSPTTRRTKAGAVPESPAVDEAATTRSSGMAPAKKSRGKTNST